MSELDWQKIQAIHCMSLKKKNNTVDSTPTSEESYANTNAGKRIKKKAYIAHNTTIGSFTIFTIPMFSAVF